MWEEIRHDRNGRSVAVLRTDSAAMERLSDLAVHRWYKLLSKRGVMYHEAQLLNAECERRLLSTDPETLDGQRTLF